MLTSSHRILSSIATATLLLSPVSAFAVDPMENTTGFVSGDPTYGFAIEDINQNGVLDPGEDLNGNGILDNGAFIVPADQGQIIPALDWLTPTDCIVGNDIQLEGGGGVVSSEGYANGCTVSFSWTWYSYGGPNPSYTDHLHVCTDTDGERNTWPGALVSGIDVVLNPFSDKVSILAVVPPNAPNEFASGNFDFTEGQTYNVSITRNVANKTISVKINDTVVVTGTIPDGFEGSGDHIAIFNRESVAGTYHYCRAEEVNIVPVTR